MVFTFLLSPVALLVETNGRQCSPQIDFVVMRPHADSIQKVEVDGQISFLIIISVDDCARTCNLHTKLRVIALHFPQPIYQSQSSSSSSCCFALLLCFALSSSSFVTLFLARTFARISLASRSRVVKFSAVRPSPSNPMMRSAPTPSMKAITQGSTWTPSLVTRKGQLSTLILTIRAS